MQSSIFAAFALTVLALSPTLGAAQQVAAVSNPNYPRCVDHYNKCMSDKAMEAASSSGRGVQACQMRYGEAQRTGEYTSANGKRHQCTN